MFVPGKPFQPSLMNADKAKAYLSEAPFRCSTPGLTCNHYTRLEKLARDKHSSLLQKSVIYRQKSFITLGPGVNVIKLFSFVTVDETK